MFANHRTRRVVFAFRRINVLPHVGPFPLGGGESLGGDAEIVFAEKICFLSRFVDEKRLKTADRPNNEARRRGNRQEDEEEPFLLPLHP